MANRLGGERYRRRDTPPLYRDPEAYGDGETTRMCRRTSHLLAGNGCEQRRRDNMDELGGSGRGDGVRPLRRRPSLRLRLFPATSSHLITISVAWMCICMFTW